MSNVPSLCRETRKSHLLIVASTLIVAACGQEPVGPEAEPLPTPAASISDAEHNDGNPHFFWLPPLVAEPDAGGTFNPEPSPEVVVCQLDAERAACADQQPGGFPVVFTPEGRGASKVRLDLEEEHYIVNWKTAGLDPNEFYRIQVAAVPGGTVLGFIDVDPERGGGGPGKGNPGKGPGVGSSSTGTVTVRVGQTLPIKFRIERGIFCGNVSDCTEEVVGPGGGTVVTNTGFAGLDIPEGALDDDALIIAERIEVTDPSECLPSELQQAEGCYRFDTDPDLGAVNGRDSFNAEVVVGVCLDPDVEGSAVGDQFQLHGADPVDAAQGVVALQNVSAPFLECGGFDALASSGEAGWLEGLAVLAGGGLHRAAGWLVPDPLWASHSGRGGTTLRPATIGWARPLAVDKVAGDGQEAEVGTPLTTDPTVRVEAAHFAGGTAPPVEGATVTFEVTAGGGTLGADGESSVTVGTDADGRASVPWTLGPEPGENVLVASVPGDGQVTFTAAALASDGSSPPSSFRVVFSRITENSGSLQLFSMRGDGSDVRRVTSGANSRSGPAWNPDQSVIAYVQDRDLRRVDADGSDDRRLAFDDVGSGVRADWSPDGGRLAYACRDGICTVRPSGLERRVIVEFARDEFFRPESIDPVVSWSPDGRWIAHASTLALDGSCCARAQSLWRVRPDGTDRQLVLGFGRGAETGEELSRLAPDFSPGGERLAFLTKHEFEDETGETEIGNAVAAVNLDGTGLRVLAGPPDHFLLFSHLTWSPDGTEVLFTAREGRGSGLGLRIFAVDVATGAIRQVSREGLDVEFSDVMPDWTP